MEVLHRGAEIIVLDAEPNVIFGIRNGAVDVYYGIEHRDSGGELASPE